MSARIAVRLSGAAEKQLLEEVSRARGEDVSDFVRRSIKRELARLGYLPDADLKALELHRGGLPPVRSEDGEE